MATAARNKAPTKARRDLSRAVTALYQVSETVASLPRQKEVVERMSEDITTELGFDFAAIQMVDQERNEIRTMHTAGFRSPPSRFDQWLTWVHPIETSTDIQADIVRRKQWERIDTWDARFDRKIWNKYKHKDLARIFGPILVERGGEQVAIGTVEAGFYKDNTAKISDEMKDRLVAYVERMSNDLARSSLSHILQEIAEIGVRELDIDLVTIYRYDQKEHRFFLPEIRAGRMRNRRHIHGTVREDDAVARVIRHGESRYSQDAQKDSFFGRRRNRYVLREKIASSAGLLLTVGTGVTGVLFANYRTRQRFAPFQRQILETFANQAAIAIENANLYQQACLDLDRTLAQVDARREIEQSITASFDEKEVLSRIVQAGIQFLGARGGSGYILLSGDESDNGALVLAAQHGLSEAKIKRALKTQNNILRQAAETKEAALFPAHDGHQVVPVIGDAKSAVAIPLVKGRHLVGVLGYETTEGHRLDSEHLELLESFAGQALVAIENARARRTLEENTERQVLVTLGNVAAGVVESIGNPLSTIRHFVRQIRNDLSPQSKHEQAVLERNLGLIELAATEALSAVKQAHDRITTRATVIKRVALQRLLEAAADRAVRGARPSTRGEVVPNLDELRRREEVYVLGDPDLLREAFERLIINAIQAVEGGGEARITCSVRRGARNAIVEIIDTGCGIASELLPDKIFRLGVSARSGGTGIGLVFCSNVIREHRGTIAVRSKLGAGSTFTVTLPLHVPEIPSAKLAARRRG